MGRVRGRGLEQTTCTPCDPAVTWRRPAGLHRPGMACLGLPVFRGDDANKRMHFYIFFSLATVTWLCMTCSLVTRDVLGFSRIPADLFVSRQWYEAYDMVVDGLTSISAGRCPWERPYRWPHGTTTQRGRSQVQCILLQQVIHKPSLRQRAWLGLDLMPAIAHQSPISSVPALGGTLPRIILQ